MPQQSRSDLERNPFGFVTFGLNKAFDFHLDLAGILIVTNVGGVWIVSFLIVVQVWRARSLTSA